MTEKEKEIQALKARLAEYEAKEDETNSYTEQKVRTSRQEKLFLVMFITFLASIPTVLVLRYIENRVEQVIYLTVGLLLLVFLISFFVIYYKERILNFIFSTTKTHVDEVLAPIPKLIDAYQKKDGTKMQKEGLEIFKMAYAKYSWLKMRGFIINSTMALFVGFGGLLGVFMIFKQNDLIESQNKLLTNQNKQVEAQTQLSEANRRSSLVFLMSNIMDKIDQEIRDDSIYQDSLHLPSVLKVKAILDDSIKYFTRKKIDSLQKLLPKKQLSFQLEARIIALSNSLRPYKSMEGDSIIKKPLSPERAQLLISLIGSGIVLKNILKRASFDGADLRDADLSGTNLNGISLSGANLSRADLRQANFKKVNLQAGNLTAAYLVGANLKGANLWGTNLSWANMKGINLKKANLIEAQLFWTNLNNSNLKETYFQGANVEWSSFNGTDLSKSDFRVAKLYKSNLNNTALDKTILPEKKFAQTSLNKRTNVQYAFTTKQDFLINIEMYNKSEEKNPFNTKKYKLIKLNINEIRQFGSENISLRHWPSLKPLYQIRLKPGYKE